MLSSVGVLLLGYINKNRLRINLYTDRDALTAKQQEHIYLNIYNLTSFPIFKTRILILAEEEKDPIKSIVLYGSSSSNDNGSLIPLYFKHRGIWDLNHSKIFFEDIFSLFRYQITLPINLRLKVYPKNNKDHQSDEQTIATKSGENLSDIYKGEGDYIEMKPYDPSDGTKRILWKKYASSGELITRKPEKSVDPIDIVPIYLIADRGSDQLANQAIQLIKNLNLSGQRVITGSDGVNTYYQEIISNDELTLSEETFLANVWPNNAGTGIDLNKFIQEISELGIDKDKLIVIK